MSNDAASKIRQRPFTFRIMRRYLQWIMLCVFLSVMISTFLFGNPFSSQSFTVNIETSTIKKRNSSSRFHLLFAAHKSSPAFCRSLTTALWYGYEPIIVNWGVDRGAAYKNKAAKLRSVYDYLQQNVSSPDDIVAMIDGTDVLTQQPPHVLLERYHELAGSNMSIILAADKKCYPNRTYCTNLPESTLPKNIFGELTDRDKNHYNNRPRYVNSGMLIGKSSHLEALYSAMVNWDPDPFGDQVVFAQFYQNRTHDIRLDYQFSMFLSLGYAGNDTVLLPDYYGVGSTEGSRFGRQVWSKLSGALPVFVHFPGKVKHLIFEWWQQSRFDKTTQDDFDVFLQHRGAVLGSTGQFISWHDLCYDLIEEEEDLHMAENFVEQRILPN